MAPTPADVIGIAPELARLNTTEVQTAIDDATLELNAEAWGARLDRGVKLLAAHLLAVTHPELSGPGNRAYTYETPTEVSAGAYARSRFGLEFWRLQERVKKSLPFAIVTT
jgi:hypothetical protein